MKYLLASVLIGVLFSCGEQCELTPSIRQEIITEVSQTLLSYQKDVLDNGLTAELAYLDSSVDFFWVPPGYSTSISYDSVATVLKQNAPLFKLIENSFDTLRIVPQSCTLATYTGKLRSKMTDTLGQINTFQLTETGTVVKRKSGWKLLNGQASLID